MATGIKAIKDQVIVITGASSGFGKGAAMVFAREGASLVLAARRGQLLNQLVRECESVGGKAIAVVTDVSQSAEVERLTERALTAFGRIDTWINNAGVGAIGKFEDIPLADHEQVIRTNLMGTLYGSYAAFRQFVAQGSGTLINTASMLGKIPTAYYTSYNASKHGILGLTATLRSEAKDQNRDHIHICTVLPMAMDTPFFEHAGNYTGREAVPVPPTYDAQKVVEAIVSLATEPKAEIIVGLVGKLAQLAHQIAPHMTEMLTAKEVHKVQLEDPKPAQHTPGAIHEPVMSGTGLHGKKVS